MLSKLLRLDRRRLEPEFMDDLALESARHRQALRGLERINQVSFSAASLWGPIQNYYFQAGRKPLRILDIASGAGDSVIALSQMARKKNLPLVFEGCDFNPRAVSYASERARSRNLDTHFFQMDALSEVIPERFDAVINSLFLHHLSSDQLARFFKSVHASRVKLMVINDLKRSVRGLALCYLGTRFLSRSLIVHKDGLLSVRAAWTPLEILQQISAAGYENVQIKSIWPMRFVLTWHRS